MIIPGPKKPKDINSFLRPLVDELIALENGQITAIDGDTGKEFVLRAHVLIVTADGPAAADAMGMKSPGNAYRPCRMCTISGVMRTDVKSPYYVPHTSYSLDSLPIRTNLRAHIDLVEVANDDESRKLTGIRGKSELLRLKSIHFPRSFPGDIMHCVLQNITPMLFQLWNGTKLSIDNQKAPNRMANEVCEDALSLPSYCLGKDDLSSIGDALAQSRKTIPLSLGHAPRRINNHYKGFKAAEWKAWLVHYGSPLLWKHLDETYLANFRDLGTFYRLATAPAVSHDDVSQIAIIARNFVRCYEKIYYRNEQARLPVCTVNIHSLLHFADWITDCGPACYFWQFPMERHCGDIKPMAKSKSKLDTSIANAVLLTEHLNHIQFVRSDFAGANLTLQDDLSYPWLANPFRLEMTIQQCASLHQARRKQAQSLQPHKRCHLSRLTTIGSRKSQVCSDTNRDDHRIVYHSMQNDSNKQQFGVVEFFATATDEDGSDDWAYIATLTGEVRHRREQIVAVQKEGPHSWIRVEQIDGLIGLIKEGDAQFYMIVSDECLF